MASKVLLIQSTRSVCQSSALPLRIIYGSFHTGAPVNDEVDPLKAFPTISSEPLNLKRGTGGRSSVSGKVATVFGATGFVARSVVNQLGKSGTQVIVPYRGGDPKTTRPLKLCGDLGQVLFQRFHLQDIDSLYKCIQNSHIVINLIGKNHETKNFPFEEVHVKGPRNIARIARECGVETLIHFSALNACEKPKPVILKNGSKFLASKWRGEQAVKEEFPKAIIFRPADIFAPMDRFCIYYSTFRRRTLRSISLWKRGKGIMKQPVFLSDVGKGVIRAAFDPVCAGNTFQAVGPHMYDLGELMDWFNRIKGKVPDRYGLRLDARFDPTLWFKVIFSEIFFTRYRRLSFERLEYDHVSDVVDPLLPTLTSLGVELTPLETKIFNILKPYRLHAYNDVLCEEYIRPVDPAPTY